MNKNETINQIKRRLVKKYLKMLIKHSNQLVKPSIKVLNQRNNTFRWNHSAIISLGLDIRKHLLVIDMLSKHKYDEHILIIFRNIFEKVVTSEYINTLTKRNNRDFTPLQKSFLFLTFPPYKGGLNDINIQADRIWQKIKDIRNRLVNDDKNWHGSSLRGICQELDKVQEPNKKIWDDSYTSLYSDLSFTSHPNSIDNFHLEVQSDLSVSFKNKYVFNEAILFSTLWANYAIKNWTNKMADINNKNYKSIEDYGIYLTTKLRQGRRGV